MTLRALKSTVRRAMARAYRANFYYLPSWCVNAMYGAAVTAVNQAVVAAQIYDNAYVRNFVELDYVMEPIVWN